MIGRRFRFLAVMAAATGLPYAWFNENVSGKLKSGWNSLSQLGTGQSSSNDTLWPVSIGTFNPTVASRDPQAPSVTAPVQRLADVLRFDITPAWILERWPRVSTVRAERDLLGFRVPLVTGTNVDDVAGSLTYYFNADKRLCRITLHGQTGSDATLVGIVSSSFGMHPEPSLGAGVYLLRWNTRPLNVLRITHAPVVRAEDPYSRFIVELELNDVAGGYGLSPEFTEVLRPDHHVREWRT